MWKVRLRGKVELDELEEEEEEEEGGVGGGMKPCVFGNEMGK